MRLTHRNQNKKDMKQLIIIMALALTASLPATAQSTHRHSKKATVAVVNKADTMGITVYSDTTANAFADEDSLGLAQPSGTVYKQTVSFDEADDPFKLMAYLGTLGVAGVFIALFAVMLVLLIFLSPLIAIALIAYWLIHRKRAEYKIAEKAIENGQPIPDGVLRSRHTDRETIWRKGIKNVAIGAGIIVFGIFFGEFFVAVGAIFVCLGIGRCVIARTSASGERPAADDDVYEDIIHDEASDKA